MTAVRLLPLLCLVGLPANAGDATTLAFAWDDDSRWRVVDAWSLELIAPDGDRIDRSGVVRTLWTWDAVEGSPPALSSRSGTVVRFTPGSDGTARAVGNALAGGWSVGPRAVAATPRSEPEPDVVPMVDLEAGELQMVPDAAAPAEAREDGAIPAGQAKPDLIELVAGSPQSMFEAVFQGLHRRTVELGRETFEDGGDGVERMVRVTSLAHCPDTGPGVDCVEVVLRMTEGAPAAGMMLEPGSRRETLTWIVEPDTLVPHGATLERTVGYTDADGEGLGAWQARSVRQLTFLPGEPVSPLIP